ncbi:Uncharacterised protein [uncultured archaeon]|nr:Uncharacterised protein [uncultured archaeon]
MYSDCPAEGNLTGVSSVLNLTMQSNVYGCSPTATGAYYNCSWNSSYKSQGNYTINLTTTLANYNQNITAYQDWFWLLNVNSTYSNANVTPATGGWSRNFTFNITVNDTDMDNVTCRLFVNTTRGYEYRGQSTVISGAGYCTITVWNFNYSDVSNATYLFELNDSTNLFNTSVYYGPNITKPAVTVNYSLGNNSVVNRSTGNTLLSAFVWDIDNSSYAPGVNTTFWVTTNGAGYDNGTINQTNGTGYARLYFSPGCAYAAGVQRWVAGVTDGRYVGGNTSINFTTNIYGFLNNTLVAPTNSQVYLRGSNVTVRLNVTDECNVLQNVSTVSITSISQKTSGLFACTAVNNESQGYYNCTFNTSSPVTMPAKYYDINLFVNNSYFNSYNASYSSAYFIDTMPVLSAPNVTPSSGGWGTTFNFSVNASDDDEDSVTVRFYERPKGGAWSLAGTQTCNAPCSNQALVFTNPYVCGDLASAVREYKFNATDSPGLPSGRGTYGAETATNNLTLSKDTVTILPYDGNTVSGNISIYRPSGNYNFILRVFDNDTGAYENQPNTKSDMWITRNGLGGTYADIAAPFLLYANTSGIFNKTFDPDCTYSIGPQNWRGGIVDSDSCYKATNSTAYTFNITTYPLIVNLSIPAGGHYRRQIDNIVLRGNVFDDCGSVSGATVTLKAEYGATKKDCGALSVLYDEGSGWYNCTFGAGAQDTGWPLAEYNSTMQASKQYYNTSALVKIVPSFNLTTQPVVENITYTPPAFGGGWGGVHKFSVDVADAEFPSDTVLVKLWKWRNATGWVVINSTNVSNSGTYTFMQRFDCPQIGANNYKFNATDKWSDSNETLNSSFTIYKDRTIAYTNPGGYVDREGNATLPLQIHIFDEDYMNTQLDTGYNGKIYITTDGTGGNSWAVANSSLITDSSGYIGFNFDPGCAPLYKAGWQDWKGGINNDTCYVDSNSSNDQLYIKGQLKNFIAQPLFNQSIIVGNVVNVTTNVSTDCQELIPASTINITMKNPNNQWESCGTSINDQGNGYYNCTWNTMYHIGGYYDIKVNSSKTDYYGNTTTFASYVYLNVTPPVVENFSVSPASGGWGKIYTYNAQLYDFQQNNITCDLYVSTNGGAWKLKNSTFIQTIPTGGAANCTLSVSNFGCTDISTNNSYKFQIFDGTNRLNTTPVSGPNLTSDSATIAYVYGNNSAVNRSGSQTTLFTAQVLDADKGGAPVQTGSSVTFWVTKNAVSFDFGNSVLTNSSGYANYNFHPTCSPTKYEVGPEYWKAGITDSCYVRVNLTSNYTTTVIGTLNNTIEFPDFGTEFLRGENVTIKSNTTETIRDDCSLGLGGVNNTITFNQEDGVTNYSCTTEDLTGGYYRCIRNTSDMRARWYNTTMVSWQQYYNNNTLVKAKHFFVKTIPVLTNDTALTNPGGWGARFYFSINVTDEDLDNVTINLYTKKNISGSWGPAKNTTILSGPINQSITLSWKAADDCNNIALWNYYFEAIDTHSLTSSTSPGNFTIEKDDVNVQYLAGDNSFTWRNGTYNSTLMLNITDLDRNNISVGSGNLAGFWVTRNASDPNSWDAGKSVATGSDGSIIYYFMSATAGQKCDYGAGIQKWRGGISGDSCYKDTNSSAYSITINSSLAPNITNVYGQGYLKGDKVPLTAKVYDDCGPVESATLSYLLINLPNSGNCNNVDNAGWNESSGWYNCTWDSAGKPYKWWNVTATASKNYYVQNSTSGTDRFFLGATPKLDSPSVDTPFGGWGANHQFSVKITSLDNAMNNVSLWKSLDNATWNLVDWQSVNMPVGTWVYFNERFVCSDYLNASSGVNYYRINSTTVFGFGNTTPVLNFTLSYDNITASIDPASNTTVRRLNTNAAFLQARIYDTNYGLYQNNTAGRIWVTLDGNAFGYNSTCSTTNGYCNINYDPQCNSGTGPQNWKLVAEDACYQRVNSTNSTLTVIGQLYNNNINPSINQILNRNTTVQLNATVKDDCNASIGSATIYWYNSTPKQIATGYNTTWNVPLAYTLSPETIKTNATLQYYDNGTNSTPVYIYGWSSISALVPANGSTYLAGQYVGVLCTAIDANTTTALANYNASFYKDGTFQTWNTTDTNGISLWNWSTSSDSFGWHNITCIIQNDSAQYYSPAIQQAANSIRINRSAVIKSITLSNPNIFRNDSFSPYATNITVNVYDALIGPASGANVLFYNSTDFIGNCTTDASGNCYITYNAYDNATPGGYIIYINSTKSGLENSTTSQTTIGVRGILFINITSPANGTSWSKAATLSLTSDIKNENGYADNATVTWYMGGGAIASGQNTTYALAPQLPGQKTLVSNATKPYYVTGTSNVSIGVNGLIDATWWNPPDGSIQAYPGSFNVQCIAVDNTSGSSVGGYSIKFWYLNGSDYIYNGTYVTDGSGIAGYTWYPQSKGTLGFKCNITANASMYYSPNIDSATATITVKDVHPPLINNASIIPNQSLEANLNSTNITAIITDDVQVYSAIASITLPNGTIVNKTMSQISNNTYSVTYMPPIGGNYSVSIMAKDSPPENNTNITYAGNFSVWGKANVAGTQMGATTIFGITQVSGTSFVLNVNSTNYGPPNAYTMNISLTESPTGALNYNTSSYSCGNMGTGTSCSRDFLVTVPAKTPPGLIYLYGTTWWTNPDRTVNSTLGTTLVDVASNPVLSIAEAGTGIANSTPHGATTTIGTITVGASGNDAITNTQLSIVGNNLALSCPLCVLTIMPSYQGILLAGSNFTSQISMYVPFGTAPANYWTYVSAISANAPPAMVLVNATVPVDASWNVTPVNFGTVLAPLNTSATIGTILVNNTGNIQRNILVFKNGDTQSLTAVSPTSFSLGVGTYSNITVSYSTTPTTSQGLYPIDIVIRNASSVPVQYNVNFLLNVTDIPPVISNISINPAGYEAGTEYSNISAIVTHNVGVSQAWINSTKPNGTAFIKYFSTTGPNVFMNYSESETGTHSIIICANDTGGLVGCTQGYNISVMANTTLATQTSITNASIGGVMLASGVTVPFNFTIRNGGYSRALNANTTITPPTNWTVSQGSFIIGSLPKNASYANSALLSVPANALGNYSINFTSNWTNYDNTSGTNTAIIMVTVASNPALNIVDNPISVRVETGKNGTYNFTLNSTGNDIAQNIQFNCTGGAACTSFNTSFSPAGVASLAKGNATNITITVSASGSQSPGIYSGIVRAYTPATSADTNLSVIVPTNLTWQHSPASISKEVAANTTDVMGTVIVSNIGNSPVFLSATLSNTTLFSVNKSSMTVPVGGYDTVSINYSAPAVTSSQSYAAYFTTTNVSAFITNQTTLLNITVHPIYLYVLSPTSATPKLNVTMGDNIQVTINLTYGLAPLPENVTWEINLTNGGTPAPASITAATYNPAQGLWTVNFTAPDILAGISYTLVTKATYTTKNIAALNTQKNAIVYTDNIPPLISMSLPLAVARGTTVLISVNATDSGGVRNVPVNITDPSSVLYSSNATLISQSGNAYIFSLNFSNTSLLGTYSVVADAYDLSGNVNTTNATFDVYNPAYFSGYTYDVEAVNTTNPAFSAQFRMYKNDMPVLLHNFSSDSLSGYYNQSVYVRTYDIYTEAFNVSLAFKNVSMPSAGMFNPILIGNIPLSLIGAGPFKAIYFDSAMGAEYQNITFDYSPYSGTYANDIKVYYCGNWTIRTGCASSWARRNSSLDTSTRRITLTSTDTKGAYAMAQYICGNKVCESDYGESNANCPQDCTIPIIPPIPPIPPITGGTSGGTSAGGGGSGGAGGGSAAGGGAGGGGAAGATQQAQTQPTTGAENVPVEIKSTLLYITLAPGEREVHSIEIKNNQNKEITSKLSVEGFVWELIKLEKTDVTVAPKSTATVKIEAYALPSTVPGIYTGDIVTTTGNLTYKTPITVKVEIKEEPLLDVILQALSGAVKPGEDAKFRVTIKNMGKTATVNDITLNYIIKSLGNGTIIKTEKDTIAVNQTLSFEKSIFIPNDTAEDRYVVDVNATYANAVKTASSAATFDVTTLPWVVVLLRRAFMSWLTYVILLIVVPVSVVGRRAYKAYYEKRAKEARYIFPMDYSKLPQKGDKTIQVGKIAETDINSYLDVKNLTMHSIAAGGTGSGKSVTAMVTAEELLKRGIPVIVFDPTAQWSGFIRPCKDPHMIDLYARYGLKPEDARAFKTNIIVVNNATSLTDEEIDIRQYMKPGEITVFIMSKLRSSELDAFVRRTIQKIFSIQWPEARDLRVLVVYDEMHRLLPKYGGKGGYIELERGCREFRKWGIGLFLISQVLSDFKGSIRANIANEIQLRTKYNGDINRVKQRYGTDYALRVVKLTVGAGLLQNPEFNDGKPWFIQFRPLLHDTGRLTEEELAVYIKINQSLAEIDAKVAALKAKGIDTYDVEMELNMARDKTKQGMFKMAETYIESVRARLAALEGGGV